MLVLVLLVRVLVELVGMVQLTAVTVVCTVSRIVRVAVGAVIGALLLGIAGGLRRVQRRRHDHERTVRVLESDRVVCLRRRENDRTDAQTSSACTRWRR